MKKRKNKILGLLEIYLNKYKCAQKIYYKKLRKLEKQVGVSIDPVVQFKDYIVDYSNEYLLETCQFDFGWEDIRWSFSASEYDDFNISTRCSGYIPIQWLDYNRAQIKKDVEKIVEYTLQQNIEEACRILSCKNYGITEEHLKKLESFKKGGEK